LQKDITKTDNDKIEEEDGMEEDAKYKSRQKHIHDQRG
jgi:hypothetical protein